MHATRLLMMKGFIARSIDELKRVTISAIKQEGIAGPDGPLTLLDFRNPKTRKVCKTMSDADMGGFSNVHLDYVPREGLAPAHVRFHGSISTELPRNRPNIQRSGYAAWRSLDRPPTIFGRTLWNIEPFTHVGFRVRSDGRKYFVNVMTETIVPTDIHQHRLYSRRPGEWETVLIKWSDFVRTNHGLVVEPQMEMLRQKVKSIGIGLIDRAPGPYDLSISRIWATNDPDGDLADEEGREVQSSPTAATGEISELAGATVVGQDMSENRTRHQGERQRRLRLWGRRSCDVRRTGSGKCTDGEIRDKEGS